MALSYDGFLSYSRLTGAALEEEGEAQTAELCYKSAIASARSHGVPVDTLEDARAELYIYAMALFEFDNRGYSVLDHSAAAIASRERRMNQLKIELELEGWCMPSIPYSGSGGAYGI